jgi:hypothetical protein
VRQPGYRLSKLISPVSGWDKEPPEMMHRSTTGRRTAKRIVISLAASACLIVGSPVVGVSSAATGGGAHKAVSADHGDCKHDNSGKHNGYDCPTAPVTDPVVTGPGPVVTTPGPVYAS